ncbi:MAG: Asp-tRNA(Asn)/Glu-tRNA(Gln) amidotransferase subunit GatA [Labilithrix sp.]|nr:Asp-tRNA(Asn)/Glu-tRNA(Gln) amidotransferase subunit GatA [Labilithrix sp.]MCW5814061.1 Asp-tRNA(Asn)/Glu-tRNA(Gln) amidotransferase subunit GatA [Labilithrix sp.]
MDTVVSIAEAVRKGERSALSVAEESLAAIEARDGSLHAFLTVTKDEMLAQARAVDDKRARGEALGLLAGVPVALKDALCTRGVPTTAASKILDGYRPPYDATVVARLRAADAIVPGKTNQDEFAMGSSTERSAYGPTKNPVDETKSPGGSSGGSAVAVAAGMAPASLGSDTGGSIRQPAAFTGCVGLKPTYGRVSRFGLIAFASSLDQIGPFANDVRGAARVLSVIAGHDGHDATSLATPLPDLEAACGRSVKGMKLGVPAQYFASGLDPEVEANVRAAIARLEKDGCTVHPVELSHTKLAVATYYVIATAEASSNLARFDGVRYGLRVEPDARAAGDKQASALRAMYGATRDAGFGPEVKRRILLGTFVLSAGHYDAYYLKAQKVRTLIKRDFEQAFASVDAVVCPTAPTPAFALGEKTSDPLSMYLSDIYTLPASLAGLPAISVPVAPAKSGLPIGLQIIGRPLDEPTVLSVAAAAEASAR